MTNLSVLALRSGLVKLSRGPIRLSHPSLQLVFGSTSVQRWFNERSNPLYTNKQPSAFGQGKTLSFHTLPCYACTSPTAVFTRANQSVGIDEACSDSRWPRECRSDLCRNRHKVNIKGQQHLSRRQSYCGACWHSLVIAFGESWSFSCVKRSNIESRFNLINFLESAQFR